jgi:hypothetical protein
MLENQTIFLGNFDVKKTSMSFCTPNKILQRFFCKISEKLPLFASPYYVEVTSLNAHKPIILLNGKKNQQSQCQFWEFRGDCF